MKQQTPREYVKKYLADGRVMQVATQHEGKPWICTVYYIVDSELNFYWLSLPTRRHSQEIATNPSVAITVAAKHDLPVIGIQAEGEVETVSDQASVKMIADLYVAKYGSAKTYYDRFVKGIHQHHLYRLVPTSIVLFDEVNFDNTSRLDILEQKE